MSTATMLVNGERLLIRPIHAEDSPALQEMHAGLTERTVYQRFLGLHPVLSPSEAAHFTQVDGVRRFALVAEATDGSLVAVGRYDRLPPDWSTAEVAFVVTDATAFVGGSPCSRNGSTYAAVAIGASQYEVRGGWPMPTQTKTTTK